MTALTSTPLVKRLTGSLRQLRWKLTLSYTVATVGALLVVELALILGVGAYVMVNSRLTPRLLIEDVKTNLVPAVRPYLHERPQGLEARLLRKFEDLGIDTSPIPIIGNVRLNIEIDSQLDLFLVAADGTLLDTFPHDLVDDTSVGRPFDTSSVLGLERPMQAAMEGVNDYHRQYVIDRSANKLVAAVPVMDEAGERVLGVLAFTTDALPWSLWPFEVIARQVGYSLLFFTLFAGVMGTFFGSLTARGLVRRLRRLSYSTNSWSRGDFSVFVDDPSGDEIGSLAQDLNRMAQQLESLLEKRQAISVMEERNRLARDLHDSAKQQAFAASAQLGAARALWQQDPEAAQAHLVEAVALVDEVRQELTHLIQELRPAALKGTGLAGALRDFALDWANQNGIEADVRVQGERPLPLETEQTLFRIAQEALANVARHSQARKAEISLIYDASSIGLAISDDGQGFDVSRKQSGLGLRSMRERAELLQGTLVVVSTLGRGTKVLVKSPY
jgi:NarL family two-component system sensor histidine kinase LiaS